MEGGTGSCMRRGQAAPLPNCWENRRDFEGPQQDPFVHSSIHRRLSWVQLQPRSKALSLRTGPPRAVLQTCALWESGPNAYLPKEQRTDVGVGFMSSTGFSLPERTRLRCEKAKGSLQATSVLCISICQWTQNRTCLYNGLLVGDARP